MIVLLHAALILLLQVLTPYWWWVMVVPFVISFVSARQRREVGAIRLHLRTALAGGIGGGAAWFVAALYWMLTSSSLIAGRVADMLHVGNPWLLLIATALLATLAASVSAVAGSSLRIALRSRERGVVSEMRGKKYAEFTP